jgi:hypothetical protein
VSSNPLNASLVVTVIVALSAAILSPVAMWLLTNHTERRGRLRDDINAVLANVEECSREAHDEMPLTPVSVATQSLTKLARDVERLAESSGKAMRAPLLDVARLLRQLHELTKSATPDPEVIVQQERVRAALEAALRIAKEVLRVIFGE